MTGLATQADLDKAFLNEKQILEEEHVLANQVQALSTKSNELLDSLKQQSAKLSEIYTNENEVKHTLQTLLKDTASASHQMSHLASSIETVTDVMAEYIGLEGMISVIPNILNDIQTSIHSLVTQSVSETLISQHLSLTVQANRRASLLAASISAQIIASKFVIAVAIPIFEPPYTIYSIQTIPFSNKINGTWYKLNIKQNKVAMNTEKYTFDYDPGHCTPTKNFFVCQPSAVQVKIKPTNCIQSLVTDSPTIEN
jgi:hypothetical protein